MFNYPSWLPGKRANIVAMALTWKDAIPAACRVNPSLEEGPWSPVEQITIP